MILGHQLFLTSFLYPLADVIFGWPLTGIRGREEFIEAVREMVCWTVVCGLWSVLPRSREPVCLGFSRLKFTHMYRPLIARVYPPQNIHEEIGINAMKIWLAPFNFCNPSQCIFIYCVDSFLGLFLFSFRIFSKHGSSVSFFRRFLSPLL